MPHKRNDLLGRLIAAAIQAAELRGETSPRAMARDIVDHHREELESFSFELMRAAVTARVREVLAAVRTRFDQARRLDRTEGSA